jgi:hypothetical protein
MPTSTWSCRYYLKKDGLHISFNNLQSLQILFHFFNKRKAQKCVSIPRMSTIIFSIVKYVLFNVRYIVNEFFMNKLVLTN